MPEANDHRNINQGRNVSGLLSEHGTSQTLSGAMHHIDGSIVRVRRRALSFVVVLLLVLAVIETGAAVTTGILRQRGWMVQMPEFSKVEISRYLHLQNPLLGWGPPPVKGRTALGLSPRPDPLWSSGTRPCISAYGDSFTYGFEAADNETYPHFLSEMLGCPVRNYGVIGYGSDQALMLVRAQEHADSAPVIILGHLSENVLRNVNRYMHLLYPGAALQFKPRFVVRDGRLDYVPLPVNSVADFSALQAKPDSVLAGDALLARPRRGFPYSVALFKWLTRDFKVQAELSGVPAEATFYSPSHSADGLGLTTEILSTFVREVTEDGKRGVVLLIPTRQAIAYAARTNVWVDQALADALNRRRIPVIHGGPKIIKRLAGADPCTLFDQCQQQHFSEVGNRMLAQIVADELARMEAIPTTSGPTDSVSLIPALPPRKEVP